MHSDLNWSTLTISYVRSQLNRIPQIMFIPWPTLECRCSGSSMTSEVDMIRQGAVIFNTAFLNVTCQLKDFFFRYSIGGSCIEIKSSGCVLLRR